MAAAAFPELPQLPPTVGSNPFDEPIDEPEKVGIHSERLESITDLADLKDKLSDQFWRLNNLYKIKIKGDDESQDFVGTFRMKKQQYELFKGLHYRNVILKARQIGFTTFIDIYILDICLFNPNVSAGIIAHHVDDARTIFEDKIRFPYDNLPPEIRKARSAQTDRSNEIKFSNGSRIKVSTSFRSGTLQYLHVSEFGKIAAKYPDKAKEIITGAIPAVPKNGMIFIESTAEGRDGAFYDMTMDAKALHDSKKTLGTFDFKFFFFPWWEDPDYRIDPTHVMVTEEDLNYFKDLEGRGIKLEDDQKAWWIKNYKLLKDEMFRENPSYADEAFKASIQGAYYGETITTLRRRGRIGNVPHEAGFPVDTFWDLGMDDSMSIWFFQHIGREKRLFDYYETSGEGLEHYSNILRDKGYSYRTHYWPHDGRVRELGTGEKRTAVAQRLGIEPITTVDRPKNTDQLLDNIEQTRNFLASCWIDEARCEKGIVCLENYRKEWDEKLGTYKRQPRHDKYSHGADALRVGGVGMHREDGYDEDHLDPEELPDY